MEGKSLFWGFLKENSHHNIADYKNHFSAKKYLRRSPKPPLLGFFSQIPDLQSEPACIPASVGFVEGSSIAKRSQ